MVFIGSVSRTQDKYHFNNGDLSSMHSSLRA